jgi:hypothetical protein
MKQKDGLMIIVPAKFRGYQATTFSKEQSPNCHEFRILCLNCPIITISSKGKTMKSRLSKMAVMNVEGGEEILAGRATAHIPQVGIYKLLAKKKADDTIEWAHFVERDNGLKEKVMRGTVNSIDEFDIVIDTVNNNLRGIFGVTMQPAEFEVRTLDGKKASDTIH